MTSKTNQPPASLVRRLRLVIWKEHQPFIAILLSVLTLGMISYFGYQSIARNRLVDIDAADSTPLEFVVDINSASWPEIVNLPGVGEKLARAIVEHRLRTGPFKTLDEIQDVPGIGASKYRQLKPFLLPIEVRGGDSSQAER